jgi:hypothetical protein
MKILQILAVIFLCISLVLLAVAGVVFKLTQDFLEKSAIAEGSVVALEERMNKDSAFPLYYPVIEFEDASGEVVEFESSFGSRPSRYDVGDIVEVRYSTEDSTRVRIDGFFSIWMAVFVTAGVGILFLVAGSVPLAIIIVARKKTSDLKQLGQDIRANIENVEVDRNTTINGKHPWRIHAIWSDPMGNEHTFKSSALLFDPSEYLKSERITVRIDPQRPSRYEVDMSFIPENRKEQIIKL